MKTKESFIIGRMPIVEAMEAGKNIDKILMQKNTTGEVLFNIRVLSKKMGIPIQIVPEEKLNAFTKANHQGVIAFTGIVTYIDLQAAIDFTFGNGQTPLFLMLDGITDVRNIGGIARSALCCGCQAILIPDKGSAALNEEAMKSSAGALDKIHFCRVSNMAKAVDTLRLNGIEVVTTDMRADKYLHQVSLVAPCCIIMGGEQKGIHPEIAKKADAFIKIPMAANFDSFNVSVAAGIVLYEAMKQRMFG